MADNAAPEARIHPARKRIVEEKMNFANGNSMNLGAGNSYGGQARDGSRPASAAWMFTVLVWRI
jgi:hypothetical protein